MLGGHVPFFVFLERGSSFPPASVLVRGWKFNVLSGIQLRQNMTSQAAQRVKATFDIPVGFLGAGMHIMGDLVNLSKTGLLIQCSQDLELGTIGRLGFAVAGERARPVYRAAFQLIQSKTPKTTTASAFLESQAQKAGHRLPSSFFPKFQIFP